MMLQYFLEKGVNISSWEMFDTEETLITIYCCALKSDAIIDTSMISQFDTLSKPRLILKFRSHMRHYQFEETMLLPELNLDTDIITEHKSPFSQDPIKVYWSKIQLLA